MSRPSAGADEVLAAAAVDLVGTALGHDDVATVGAPDEVGLVVADDGGLDAVAPGCAGCGGGGQGRHRQQGDGERGHVSRFMVSSRSVRVPSVGSSAGRLGTRTLRWCRCPPLVSASRARISAWLRRWRPLLPLFGAELIVLVGFGALLPVLPLYIEEHGIDPSGAGHHRRRLGHRQAHLRAHLGLVGRPAPAQAPDGGGLFMLGRGQPAAAVLHHVRSPSSPRASWPAWSAAAYDPAARGMVVDATAENERGEAFGYYGAFQIAGFVIGPAIGGFGATIFGGYTFPFIFTSILSLVGAVVLVRYLDPAPHAVESGELRARPHAKPVPAGDPFTRLRDAGRAGRHRRPRTAGAAAGRLQPHGRGRAGADVRPAPLLRHVRGGVVDLPHRARSHRGLGQPHVRALRHPRDALRADRGPASWTGAGRWAWSSRAAWWSSVSGVVYATASHYLVPSLVVPFEAAATAAMMPALYAMLARGTPRGRSSTAQGIFGATSTLALVVASVAAGGSVRAWHRPAVLVLRRRHRRLPRGRPAHLPLGRRSERPRARPVAG